MRLILTRQPSTITREIRTACQKLGSIGVPGFIPIRPASRAVVNRCILNVRDAVTRGGGGLVTGWRINAWPRVLVQFIGHAVLDRDGTLTCITPDAHDLTQVLFAPDPSIDFNFDDPEARMPVRFVPIDPHPNTERLIAIILDTQRIREQYPRTSGDLILTGQDAIRMQRHQYVQRTLIRDIALRVLKLGDRCVCDSGKMFHVCCRPGMRREVRGAQ